MSSPAPSEPWTVRRLLDWTVPFLRKHQIESPQTEARTLLAHVLGVPAIEVIVRMGDEPTDDERTRYRELIQKRVAGTPTAYLTGTRDFFISTFVVSPAVLIPRPDTETLVVAALDLLKGKANPVALDLGTGSGCIAISLAKRNASLTVDAVDVSGEALAVARRNAERNGVADRVNFLEGDWLGAVPAGKRYDLVASNPPYIATSEIATLDAGVRDFEPRLALDGGPDGLAFYRRLADGASAVLLPGGVLAVEVGYTQAGAVRDLFQAAGLTVGKTHKDGGGIERVVTARAG